MELKTYTVYNKDGQVLIHTTDITKAYQIFQPLERHYIEIGTNEPVVIDSDDYSWSN